MNTKTGERKRYGMKRTGRIFLKGGVKVLKNNMICDTFCVKFSKAIV